MVDDDDGEEEEEEEDEDENEDEDDGDDDDGDDDDDDGDGVHSMRFIRICFNAPVLASITLTICFLRYTWRLDDLNIIWVYKIYSSNIWVYKI